MILSYGIIYRREIILVLTDYPERTAMKSRLISHMVGDYLLQSHWMATEKRKDNKAAAIHAALYTAAFLPHKPKLTALVGIGVTHYLIDRYGLARYVVHAKNHLSPEGITNIDFSDITPTGMPEGTPQGLAVGLNIVADNTLHLVLNDIFLGRDE